MRPGYISFCFLSHRHLVQHMEAVVTSAQENIEPIDVVVMVVFASSLILSFWLDALAAVL